MVNKKLHRAQAIHEAKDAPANSANGVLAKQIWSAKTANSRTRLTIIYLGISGSDVSSIRKWNSSRYMFSKWATRNMTQLAICTRFALSHSSCFHHIRFAGAHPIRRCSRGHSAKWCHFKLLGCTLAICCSCLQGGLMSFKFSWYWLATSTTVTWLATFVDSLVVLCSHGILKSVSVFSHPKTGV